MGGAFWYFKKDGGRKFFRVELFWKINAGGDWETNQPRFGKVKKKKPGPFFGGGGFSGGGTHWAFFSKGTPKRPDDFCKRGAFPGL